MNDIQFTTFLADIQPISLPFYLDIYNNKSYDFNATKMISGEFVIEIDGYCCYNNYATDYNIVLNVLDNDSNYIEINTEQYKKLKKTVINNIVTNGSKYSKAI